MCVIWIIDSHEKRGLDGWISRIVLCHEFESLRQSTKKANEKMSEFDMLHAKRIALEVNKNVPLGKCDACGELKLRLVNEI
jgi:hypothetical protein